MASEKSQNPFENLDSPSDSVAGPSNTSPANAEPPPYTPTATDLGTDSPPQPGTTQSNKPIAIPAIEPSFDSPFLRAYAPILTAYNLPRESFFTFLDHLNKLITSNPPLQVLDATGGILQSVPILFPLHWLGSAVSGLANLGSHGVSKSRTDSYIRQANQEIFGPRGLKVEIVKHDALAYIANIPILDSKGKVSRQMPDSQRLLNEAGAGTATSANWQGLEQGQVQGGVDLQQQRIKILQPWIAELELDILPWTSKSKLTRFNATLKKKNGTDPVDSGSGRRSESYYEEMKFRKCLWLLIRPNV
ncbi:uncharacterized protein ASPGLDRAFT_37624 [Aspergillus glaucus CBS 516.65]|uniref:Uncharacterized protein n=1 Tax=Aspergillus glaucus CBS 516.65 TaxID=1160497 RepID=A0A1L9VD27_ASPGL|nr:hypothetical protein ASPGLDRAFT_37624 [Aspergillus glaucus CBS 516.65]OJJ81800.1 hypothetical protein ASPGLDRAFT_37624 [Aspergillus glaucus CBS 516.65]